MLEQAIRVTKAGQDWAVEVKRGAAALCCHLLRE